MILSDREIRLALNRGLCRIVPEPPAEALIRIHLENPISAV
jgi:hypothetical protein